MKLLVLLLVLLAALAMADPATAGAKRPMELADLFKFRRVSDPRISPDGKLVAYTLTSVDLENNSTSSSIWLAPTSRSEPRPLTNVPGKKDRHPRWSPDGKYLLFESNRGGSMQLWVIALGGGEARQLTSISTDASSALWSPDGQHIAFVSAVYPEFSSKSFKESDEANKKKMAEIAKSPVKAKVFTRLFYRHWDSYVEDKRQHLFVIPFEPDRTEGYAEPKDVTPGGRDAYPTSSAFETGDNYTFTGDSKHLVFTAVPEKNEAWSTNYDLCRVPITGGKAKWECLTKENAAADSGPLFSRDGTMLAYRAQKRAGFEADKWDLMIVATAPDGTFSRPPRNMTQDLDRSIESYVWLPDSQTLFLTAKDEASVPIWELSLKDGGKTRRFLEGGTNGSLSVSAEGNRLAFTNAALTHPPLVGIIGTSGGKETLRKINPNAELLESLDLPRPESVKVKVEGADMQMWILKPPGFDPKKKWPVVYLVHGGPQGVWEDGWSYRWNPSLWAAQGYVVALPNPRGSTGFGQKFVDEISGDWGGKCYDDLMKGLDYVEKLSYVDKDCIGSAGGSFGGYMMNWFAVNTGRFKCLITHCSVWNFDSMYATTDELWFDEWEHGGPPWGKKRDSYENHSPQRKAGNLGKFKTPMLVIHNDLDFRCPIGQGHELFTALQRLGVPSRFINFPDEGHWVTKPRNSEYWHKEVFAWLTKHVPAGPK